MSPFTPYICELMFQNLRNLNAETQNSVHFLSLPQPVTAHIDLVIERRVKSMQYVISSGRVMRDKRTVPMKVHVSQLCLNDVNFFFFAVSSSRACDHSQGRRIS